jgi:hypothetical protein
MIMVPQSENERFVEIINGQARRFNLEPKDYLQKIWYHEEAAKLGEYVALSLMDELLPLIPCIKVDELNNK